jgi:hypothetical protein
VGGPLVQLTGVLVRGEGTWRGTGRTSCDDGSRGWSNASTSKECQGFAATLETRRKTRNRLSQRAFRESVYDLDFGLLASSTVRIKYCYCKSP